MEKYKNKVERKLKTFGNIWFFVNPGFTCRCEKVFALKNTISSCQNAILMSALSSKDSKQHDLF